MNLWYSLDNNKWRVIRFDYVKGRSSAEGRTFISGEIIKGRFLKRRHGVVSASSVIISPRYRE